jgi:uncharacterized SAM-binding protein YcdF (DUF218 family)
LLLAAAGLVWIPRRPRAGALLAGIALAGLWALSLDVVADRLERSAEHDLALDPTNLRTSGAQAIAILGGGGQRRHAPEYGGPAANPYLLERLAYGAWLAKRTGLPVLVTGDGIEAEAMRASLSDNFGVEARWVEDQSRDTFENARNSAAMLRASGVEKVLLVSSAAHVWRGKHEFGAAGLGVVPAPVRVWTPLEPDVLNYLPSANALVTSSDALHELIGESVRRILAVTHLRRQGS